MTATIAELAAGYRDGSRSPVEATQECLAAIASLEGRVGAWQAVYADEARAAAEAAEMALDLAAGEPLGPFWGVPFALKDIVDVEGRVTTAGSAAWADRISPATGTVARRLLEAGGILLGKTKTVEFAMGGWGTNQHMGTPWNPWDADVARTPGGSSSGSGAAVASGMAPCAVGTDTGGSVRLPAALCGIVGLKTTEGLLPIDGIVPLSHTLDTPGPLARSVLDAALMFDAMLGTPPVEVERDWQAGDGRYGALRAAVDDGLGGRRIGCLSEAERVGVEADQLAAYDAALKVLAVLGADVVPFDPPTSFEEMKNTRFVIVTAESYHYYGKLMEDPNSKVDERVRARGAARGQGPGQRLHRGHAAAAYRLGRVRRSVRGVRCNGDTDHADAAAAGGRGRRDEHSGVVHPCGQLPGPVIDDRADRRVAGRPADIDPVHVPGRRRDPVAVIGGRVRGRPGADAESAAVGRRMRRIPQSLTTDETRSTSR